MKPSALASDVYAPPLPLRAALLMLASATLFAMMAVVVRLASAELHPFEIAFFRSLFGALFAAPLLLVHGTTLLRTPKLGFYFVRCAIGVGAMMAGFWSIVNLPMAQAIALSYASPMFVTIGAVVFLREVVRMRRWSAVIVGFIGVLVIVRPGGASFTPASLVALSAAAMSGAVTISIKFLARSEPPDRIVLLTTWLWVPLTLPGALFVWQTPSAGIWPWLVLSGALGTSGHYCWTRALRMADASVLAPLSYLQLPVVAFMAWLLFAEAIDRYTVAGALIIIAASIYIARREAVLARRRHKAAMLERAEPVI